MRRVLIGLFIFSFIGFSSCIIERKNEEKKEEIETTEKTACDEFLEEYEDVMEEYVNVIEEYYNNPEDEVIAARYLKLMNEALNFNSKWEALIECADDEKYRSKFEEISHQVEEKLAELGL